MGVVLVGGIHAVGKTTTIEAARKLSTREVPLIKGSEILARLLGVSTEEIPHVDPEMRAMARVAMYDELARATNGVRDCHFCTYSDAGFEFPFESSANLGQIAAAVVLEADAATILERRYMIERDRPKDLTFITTQLHLEREAAQRVAERLGIQAIMISNNDNDDAPQRLAELFNTYIDEEG